MDIGESSIQVKTVRQTCKGGCAILAKYFFRQLDLIDMRWFSSEIKHLPTASGPYIPGCVDIMLDYSKNGLFLRLFYPSDAKNNNNKKWIPWIPNMLYLIGMSTVLKINYYILRFVLWWYGICHIPVLYRERARVEENMKCIVLSHGLGGSRFLYSKISLDLASHGFLVACVEHRDNSACHTYYYDNEESARNNRKTAIDFRHIAFGKDHYEKRNEQVRNRSEECLKTVQFFIDLNDNKIPKNALDDLERGEFRLQDLAGKIDVDNFTLIGHSFGAATVLYTASKLPKIKQAVLLDPWMFPIKNENLHETIDIPLLFINTQTFHIDSNVKAMDRFLSKENREMYTINDTTHENQTDSVFVSRYWLDLFVKKADPHLAMEINNALILKFLHRYSNTPVETERFDRFLKENSTYFKEGLTKPWKK
ncbi:unnamed protein product [Phyllotreta striolata]|uniref:1-alkyl-2-acetylglycerophosphocholine esterase n=1 Tax=Phyllotreta striolata TaxID=444603 RepID=A0A9N9U120_PHYSR|nr:unnamed protein product [Phyllotreta striolata]